MTVRLTVFVLALTVSQPAFAEGPQPQLVTDPGDARIQRWERHLDYTQRRVERDARGGMANVESSASRIADNFRDGFHRSVDRFERWWFTPPPEENGKRAIPASYCYNSFQDVLCYRQPMPGWEHRLVGYQGTAAVPPPPAVMEPLPVRAQEKPSTSAGRIANAQPVFTEMPVMEKEAESTQTQEEGDSAAPDVSHQTLPDPALAPQL